MTKTVLNNALLLQAIAGNDNIDDRSFAAPKPEDVPKYHDILSRLSKPKDLTSVRIGIMTESLNLKVMDPRVNQTFLNAVSAFEKLGATVEEVSIPLHSKASTIWTAISKTGGYLTKLYGAPGRRGHAMHELNNLFLDAMKTPENWDKTYVATKNIYLNGFYATQHYPALQAKATNLSRKLRDDYDAALKKFDVLLTPTLPFVATSHPKPDDGPLEQVRKQVGLTTNTCPFNQTGHPVLTMPIGMLEPLEGPGVGKGVKLPVGIQVIGPWWGEEKVFRVGHAWESAYAWKEL
jgi:amidase